jgi:hypothetical protein
MSASSQSIIGRQAATLPVVVSAAGSTVTPFGWWGRAYRRSRPRPRPTIQTPCRYCPQLSPTALSLPAPLLRSSHRALAAHVRVGQPAGLTNSDSKGRRRLATLRICSFATTPLCACLPPLARRSLAPSGLPHQRGAVPFGIPIPAALLQGSITSCGHSLARSRS